MILRAFLVGVIAVTVAGCGSNVRHDEATSTLTTPVQPMSLTVFAVVDGGLRARTVHVPKTRAVAAAALGALGVDAAVTIADGTANVALDTTTPEETAEIVYTLTQFPAVHRVDVGGRMGLTRDDVAAFVPPILVEAPAAHAEVPGSITVSGTASVFEATLVVELRRGGRVLTHTSVTASEGAPGRGTFSVRLRAPSAGAATVAAYAPSAADGSRQHEQDVPVTVMP
jgi:Immunoglobulin-like domain of bacterial spore germination